LPPPFESSVLLRRERGSEIEMNSSVMYSASRPVLKNRKKSVCC
jgi:hypothetical protein